MNTTCRILLSAALFAWSVPSLAQEQFNTPEEAVDALVGAAKTGDAKAIDGSSRTIARASPSTSVLTLPKPPRTPP